MARSCRFWDIFVCTITLYNSITVYSLSKCLEAGQWIRCPSEAIYALYSFQRKKTRGELPNNKNEVKELPGEHNKAMRRRHTHTQRKRNALIEIKCVLDHETRRARIWWKPCLSLLVLGSPMLWNTPLTFCVMVFSAFRGGLVCRHGGITVKVIRCTFGCGFSIYNN